MPNEDAPNPSRQLKWRLAGLAMVLFGAGLGVIGLIRGVQDARQMAGRFIDQAKPQARQLANAVDGHFRTETKSSLKLVADNERFLGKMRSWQSSDFPHWITHVFVVDQLEPQQVYGPPPSDVLLRAVRRRLNARLAFSEPGTRGSTPPRSGADDRAGAGVFVLHDRELGEATVLACIDATGARNRPVTIAAVVDTQQLRESTEVDRMIDLTPDLELVRSGDVDQPWSQALSGPLRAWSIQPTAGFVAEQRSTALWQSLNYFAMTMLSIVSLLVAMWFIVRTARREVALAEMKSNFVADVSHELKTPLALIRLFGETLQTGRVRDEAKRQEYYSVITRESTRLTNLIENILDFARIDSGRKEYAMRRVDVAKVVEEMYAAYRVELDHGGFEHELTIQPDLPLVDADRDAIAQAVLNLISNGIKYSGDEKYLHIDLKRDTRRGRRGVLISVEDHGIGIRPEDRAHLFEGFYRSSDQRVRGKRGTGLGLALVKHIVDAHGGYLDVESRLVRGSTFRIFLPAAPEPPGTPDAEATPTPAEAEGSPVKAEGSSAEAGSSPARAEGSSAHPPVGR